MDWRLHASLRVALLTAALATLPMAVVSADELVAYQITDGHSIEKSLTGKPGDPAKGREVVIDRKLGNCLACHKMPIPDQSFQGEIGPDLKAVGNTLKEGEIRLRVVNSKVVNSASFMPAFYRTDGLNRVMKDFEGKSILTAAQVEDIVAYLMTLKGK